jgi:hypothetical protein
MITKRIVWPVDIPVNVFLNTEDSELLKMKIGERFKLSETFVMEKVENTKLNWKDALNSQSRPQE